MNIYIAAPFKYRDTAREWAEKLSHLDTWIIAEWLESELDDSDYQKHHLREAMRDFGNIRDSDIFVLMSVDEPQRGGCLIEYGYALGQGVPCVVIGPKDWNQFFTLAKVQFETIEEFVEWLNGS